MISIYPSNPSLFEKACILSKQWGFQLVNTPDAQYYLELTEQHLQLVQTAQHAINPIYVDFTSGQTTHRRQFGGGKGQMIAKAVGLHKGPPPVILDATAGMGKDAFVFASLGAQVLLMERSPISAALLADGLQRAVKIEEITNIIKRMNLIFGDARLLNSNDAHLPPSPLPLIPDVIYLDPMFPHRKKTALVKKEMRAFQDLIGNDNDSNELLEVCCETAKKRVVVKRPIKAPFLNAQKPSLTMKMKKHRFDIYLV